MAVRVLVLGTKEYPLGSNDANDPIPSGGIERYIENLLREFKEYPDVQIVVITRKFPVSPPFQATENIRIHRVGWLKGFLLRNPTFNLNAFLLSLSLEFDLIWCVGVFASFFGVILSVTKGVPVVHHFAGLHHSEPQYNFFIKRILFMMETVAYRFRGGMIFLSKGNEENFKSIMGFLPRQVHVVPTGVDIEHFCPTCGRKAMPPVRLITVGRLSEVKGIQDLLEALRKLRDILPLLARIVGDGPYRKDLERLVERYSLKERVVFEGNVIPGRVVDFLREANIYVLPSYSEGLPQSLLEAMACGLPCIVTDIGLPIKNEETGIVVPPSNANAIAQAILRLAASPSLMETLGENARKYVLSNHSPEKWAATIYEISRNLKPQKAHLGKLTTS